MKNNLNCRLLAITLSLALMLNSGGMAFATDEGTPGADAAPIVTQSEASDEQDDLICMKWEKSWTASAKL